MWSQEEPNDWNGEDCVQIAKEGLLNDFPCTSELYFLCQLPVMSTSGTSPTCPYPGPNPVLIHTNKCFVFMTNEKKQPWEAQKACEEMINGTLAELSTEEERLFVSQSVYFNVSLLILGANDSDFEGEFIWVRNQSLLRLNWWASGEPNNANGQEYCVSMSSISGEISSDSCEDLKPFLCQLEVPNPCDTILPGAIYSDGQCFKMYTQSMNWSQVQKKWGNWHLKQ
uniref:C-type lectin domain-containing protein n=1 Tax=Biomphalaria glabrata TaxID=6526 RepID=A0A2C9L749_BIOGL